jgi:hypothetical protein
MVGMDDGMDERERERGDTFHTMDGWMDAWVG